jgi:hypothetical protein
MKQRLLHFLVLSMMAAPLWQCHPGTDSGSHSGDTARLVAENLSYGLQKISYFLENLDPNTYPGSINDQGELETLSPSSWEAGYLAGILWQLYDYSGEERLKIYAQQWTAGLKLQQFEKNSHDLLYMLFSSFGNGYKTTGDTLYKDVLLVGAELMAGRFNPDIGCIKSWDPIHMALPFQFPVIVDAMMANEMFFYVTEISGDSSYAQMAYQHALRTKEDFFRENYSTYYLVDYDSLSGRVREKGTWLGQADESTWARGQARAIYGSAITFRETGDSAFLDLARAAADFYMGHPRLPEDKVPYWDFDDPDIPNAPRDVSAACIAVSGLLELSSLLPGDRGKPYLEFAVSCLQSLSSDSYRNRADENLGFILKHSTGSRSWNLNVDKPKISADYYFIESLIKLHKIIQDSTGQKLSGSSPSLN